MAAADSFATGEDGRAWMSACDGGTRCHSGPGMGRSNRAPRPIRNGAGGHPPPPPGRSRSAGGTRGGARDRRRDRSAPSPGAAGGRASRAWRRIGAGPNAKGIRPITRRPAGEAERSAADRRPMDGYAADIRGRSRAPPLDPAPVRPAPALASGKGTTIPPTASGSASGSGSGAPAGASGTASAATGRAT